MEGDIRMGDSPGIHMCAQKEIQGNVEPDKYFIRTSFTLMNNC